jgi:uncharacterized RDD family membrane protein YckC
MTPPPPPESMPPSQYGGGYPAQAYPAQAKYGGFWIRLVAYIIDAIIVAIPVVILAFIIGAAIGVGSVATNAGQSSTNAAANGASGVIDLIAFLISAGYFIFFWSTGQTLAMRLFGLRVVDANTGQPIGIGRAVVRYLGFIVSGLVCYIGFIWAAFDSRKQGWHDKIGGTVVLQG